MELQEIRRMLQLMDNFAGEEPLIITATDITEVSDEEISHIKITQKEMRKGRRKCPLERFVYGILP
ncbi:hypothetical protein FACS189435_1960 [Bacteroidia bacterium]|nr:hypothetical protein FACS189435_1960 [Bacteroidia bacterium]